MIDENKRYKLYLVEVDDHDRERVISGLVGTAKIEQTPHWEDMMSIYDYHPVGRYITHTDVTVTIELIPDADGNIFTIEYFNEEDDYEVDE